MVCMKYPGKIMEPFLTEEAQELTPAFIIVHSPQVDALRRLAGPSGPISDHPLYLYLEPGTNGRRGRSGIVSRPEYIPLLRRRTLFLLSGTQNRNKKKVAIEKIKKPGLRAVRAKTTIP
jgi:hypothetical protein